MTDPSYIYRPNFPLVGARRNIKGEYEPQFKRETKTIFGGIVKLREVPQFSGIGTSIFIDGFTEVTTDPGPLQFRTNYITGRLYFNAADNGKTVTIEYYGLGSLVAIDEINYIWYLITKKFRFLSLFDTPESYNEASYKYLRVNKTGTGLIFSVPELGESMSRLGVFYIPANEIISVSSDSLSKVDIVKIYEVTNGESTSGGIENSSSYVEEVDEATVTTVDNYWTLSLPVIEAGKGYYIECNDEIDTSDWNYIDKIYFDESVSADEKIRYLIKADDEYYGWSGSYFFKLNSFTGDSILVNGISNDAIQALGPQHFEIFVGKRLSFVASLSTLSEDHAPTFRNKMTVEGWKGKTYQETNVVNATYFPSENTWNLENTSDEAINVVAIFGSGRDDSCCSVSAFTFEDLAPDTPVEIKANIQTTCQVMQSVTGETVREGILLPTTPGSWEVVDNPYALLFVEYSDTFALEFEECKNIENTGYNFKSIFKFKDGKVVDSLGNFVNYDIIGEVAPVPTPFGVGITLRHLQSHGVRISDDGNDNCGICFFIRSSNNYVTYYILSTNNLVLMSDIYSKLAVTDNTSTRTVIMNYTDSRITTLGNFSFAGIGPGARGWAYNPSSDSIIVKTRNSTGNCIYIGRAPNQPSRWGSGNTNATDPTKVLDVALAWVGDDVNNLEVIRYVIDQYQSLMSYYSSAFGQYTKTRLHPPFNSSDITVDNVSPRNFSTDELLNFNPNRYLVELDGILYRWDTTNLVFEEVSSTSSAENLYNAGNTLEEIGNIPEDAWHDKNPSTLAIWIIAYTDWNRAPVVPTKVDINKTEVTADGWRVLKAGEECTVEWYPGRRIWRVKHHLPENYTIKVIVAGLTTTNVRAQYFTELLDTPDSLDYHTPQVLAAKNGRVTTIPYINPWIFLRP